MSSSKPEVSLVKLDGTLIHSDGTQKKSNLFKYLDLHPDNYSDITFTPEEARKVTSHICNLTTGSTAAIPIICGGKAKCPFAHSCPFVRVDENRKKTNPGAKLSAPIGRQCYIEVQLMDEWTKLYIQEYDILEENFTQFLMVRELVEIELMLWRLNNNISKPEHAELVQETTVGVDKGGNPLTRLEVNSFFEAKERLQNRKSRIIKLMVGDRESQYKRDAALRTKTNDDPSTNSAKLRGQINRLLTQAKTLDIKLKEKEGKVIDADSKTVDQSTQLTPEDLING